MLELRAVDDQGGSAAEPESCARRPTQSHPGYSDGEGEHEGRQESEARISILHAWSMRRSGVPRAPVLHGPYMTLDLSTAV